MKIYAEIRLTGENQGIVLSTGSHAIHPMFAAGSGLVSVELTGSFIEDPPTYGDRWADGTFTAADPPEAEPKPESALERKLAQIDDKLNRLLEE